MDKDQIIQTLQESNAALTQTNKELQATIKDLQDTIKDLQNTIKDLQNRLNQNSQNSSMPPSKDGFNKPNPRSLRPKSEKKPGGQKGHAGSHMSIPHEPDEVCKHLPARCALCPHLSECLVYGKVFSCVEKRYVKAVRTKVLNLLNFLSVDFGTSEISCFVFLSYYSLRICLLRFWLLSECCDQCTTQ